MTLARDPERRTLQRHLRAREFLTLRRPGGLTLRADRGTLWVTVDGQPDDIEINAGECRVFDGHADVVVGTLGGDAWMSATVSAAPGRTARLFGRLLGRLELFARRLPA